jgi:hypothetical protein
MLKHFTEKNLRGRAPLEMERIRRDILPEVEMRTVHKRPTPILA